MRRTDSRCAREQIQNREREHVGLIGLNPYLATLLANHVVRGVVGKGAKVGGQMELNIK